ncbi:MAG: YggS family pyridoxal phosphate-dependent enzyme [Actinomycetota bacterium]|nr:YggS family pyridoxal phosphate-dependent enzyme [Actinomycetota bacterium]
MPDTRDRSGNAGRTAELRENLDRVKARIAAATKLRPAGAVEPTLIVVTKFHSAADVLLLAGLGVQDIGENRDQEAAAKAAEVAGAGLSGPALRWHFIGQLQTNKAKSVVAYAHSVHSVDRPAVVKALSTAVLAEQERTGREALACFVQVNLDPAAAGRGGVESSAVLDLAALIRQARGLRLAGVMAVAPLGGNPDEAFARLAGISAVVARKFPEATAISAGMSGDLEAAISHGATHLRVGSDVLGARPALR